MRTPQSLKAQIGSNIREAADALQHAVTMLKEGEADPGVKKLSDELQNIATRLKKIQVEPIG